MTPTTRRRAWAARSPRLPALLAASLAWALAVAGPVGAAPGPTPAAALARPAAAAGGSEQATAGLRILLDEVDPVVVRPGRSVTLRGRLVNDGPDVSRSTLVTVAAAPVALGSRADVAGWVEGTDLRSATWVLGDDALGSVIPAGGEEQFEVTVPGPALESLPAAPAVLGLELVAAAQDEADRAPVPGGEPPAVLRTVLTSAGQPLEVDVPLETAWVVPLTLPADADLSSPDDTAHAAAWLAAVGRGSAVRGWLDHLTVADVTWWIDPAALMAHRPAEALVVPGPAEGPEEPGDTDPPEDTGDTGDTGDTEEPDGPGDLEEPVPPGQTARPGAPTADPGISTAAPTPASPTPPTDADGAADADRQTAAPDGVTTTAPAPVPPPAPDPEPEVQTLGGALTELRQRLAEVDPDRLWWLPTDDPDLAVLAAGATELPADLTGELMTRLPARAPAEVTRLLRQGRDDVAWPLLPAPTPDDIDALAQLYDTRPRGAGGLGAVLVPRESFTADSSAPPRLGAVPLADAPDVLALGADSWTSALVAASAGHAEEHGAGAAAQRVLAHTLGTWQEAPASPRTLVIAPPRATAVPPEVLDQLSDGWARARWLQPVAADEVLDRAADHGPVGLSGVGPQEEVLGPLTDLLVPPASPVTPSRAADHLDLQEQLDGLAEILRETDALRSWEPVLAAQWSTRWRQDEAAWVYLWRSLRHEVRSTREAVYLLPSNVNFLADQGVIHLTVVNDLPVAVEGVRLRAQPDNGRLQITGQPEPLDVGPGSRASVPFQARAITGGGTVLQVRLSTPNGTALGQEAAVDVRVQPTGVWIYWVLGGLAGVILVLGLRRAIISGPRTARGSGATGAATTYPDPSPSPRAKESPQ